MAPMSQNPHVFRLKHPTLLPGTSKSFFSLVIALVTPWCPWFSIKGSSFIPSPPDQCLGFVSCILCASLYASSQALYLSSAYRVRAVAVVIAGFFSCCTVVVVLVFPQLLLLSWPQTRDWIGLIGSQELATLSCNQSISNHQLGSARRLYPILLSHAIALSCFRATCFRATCFRATEEDNKEAWKRVSHCPELPSTEMLGVTS